MRVWWASFVFQVGFLRVWGVNEPGRSGNACLQAIQFFGAWPGFHRPLQFEGFAFVTANPACQKTHRSTSMCVAGTAGQRAIVLRQARDRISCDAAIERHIGTLKQVYMPSLIRVVGWSYCHIVRHLTLHHPSSELGVTIYSFAGATPKISHHSR